jgi:large subunit ribosomal protein L4
MAAVLKNLGVAQNAILVLGARDESVDRASRNIPTLKNVPIETLSVLDILNCDKFILTADAISRLEEVYAS